MRSELEKLKLGIQRLGLAVTADQIDDFGRYITLLIEWNKKMNLTAIDKPDEIVVEHFLDSLSILRGMDIEDGTSVLDVGTGAGFPGIPIKIIKPRVKLALLDSLGKRIRFLKTLVDELHLDGVETLHKRAEDMARDEMYRESFDLVVSRAVAPLNILVEYCIPYVKIGGYFVSYKGPAAHTELQNAQKALVRLGGKPGPSIEDALVPFSEKTRNLIFIQKETATAKKYPRSPGKIKKSPL